MASPTPVATPEPKLGSTERPRPASPRRRGAGPPRRERSGWLSWLSLVLCLSGVSLPLLLRIGEPGLLPGGEAEALAQLEATQQQRQAEGAAWSQGVWTPVVAGEVRYDEPPGALWLQLAALSSRDAESIDREVLVRRARLATAVMMLLAVAGTFWAAHAIGGVLPATLAALSLGSMPLWLFWGRTAEPTVVACGWMMLSIGAGLWATRPLRPPAPVPRQVLGWTLCGVFLAGTVLTGGLRMLPPALAPMVVVLVIAPGRVGHLLGLLAAVVVAGLCVTPWALYIHEHDVHAWWTWWLKLVPTRWERPMDYGGLMSRRLGVLLLLLLPWTSWVLAGLGQTFSTSTGDARFRMLIGWVWFVGVAGMMIASPGDGLFVPLLLAVPAGAVVVGQLFRRFSDLSLSGRAPRLWRWIKWPHVVTLALLSAVLPAAAYAQSDLVRWGWLERPWVAPMSWQYWAAGAGAGLALVGWSARTAWRHEPARSGVLWGVWGLVMAGILAGPVARGPLGHERYAVAAAEIMGLAGGAWVVQVKEDPLPRPWASTLRFHTGMSLPVLDRPDEPGEPGTAVDRAWVVLTPVGAEAPAAGWSATAVRRAPLLLWCHPAAAGSVEQAPAGDR